MSVGPTDLPRTPLPDRPGGFWAWLGIGALVFALAALFSLGFPPMSSPDEPSHAVRAAAVAHGQITGEMREASDDIDVPGAATVVRLPADWADVPPLPNCFAFQPAQPADCQLPVAPPAGSEPVEVETFAGQYPPLYYLLVGWPSLLLNAWPALFAMRLVSALITAAFVTWGLHRLTRSGTRAGVWGAMVALTPMVFFLGATINPAGFEIVAAFSFWAATLALVNRAGPPDRGAWVQAAVSGAVLVNSRSTGPVWALSIVVVVLVLAPPGRWRELTRTAAAKWVALVALLASAAAVAWLVTNPDVVTTEDRYPQFADPIYTIVAILNNGPGYLQNMVGDFGWLDTPVPPLTWIGWYVAAGAVVLLGLAAERGRRRWAAVALVLVGTAGAPFALQLPIAVDAGTIWQGRYGLPLAMGVPLVAALVAHVDTDPVGRVMRRVARATVPIILVAHVAAYYWGLHRYAEGIDGEMITLSPEWTSPVGYLSAVAAFGAVATVLAWIAWRYLRPVAAPVAVRGRHAAGVAAPAVAAVALAAADVPTEVLEPVPGGGVSEGGVPDGEAPGAVTAVAAAPIPERTPAALRSVPAVGAPATAITEELSPLPVPEVPPVPTLDPPSVSEASVTEELPPVPAEPASVVRSQAGGEADPATQPTAADLSEAAGEPDPAVQPDAAPEPDPVTRPDAAAQPDPAGEPLIGEPVPGPGVPDDAPTTPDAPATGEPAASPEAETTVTGAAPEQVASVPDEPAPALPADEDPAGAGGTPAAGPTAPVTSSPVTAPPADDEPSPDPAPAVTEEAPTSPTAPLLGWLPEPADPVAVAAALQETATEDLTAALRAEPGTVPGAPPRAPDAGTVDEPARDAGTTVEASPEPEPQEAPEDTASS